VQLLGLVGVAALALASLAVGGRLVLLAARTGRVPELWIGLSYLFAGFLACLATLLGPQLHRAGSAWAPSVSVFGAVTLHLGVGCLAVFVWAVFHRGSRAGAVATALALGFVGLGLAGVLAEGPGTSWDWVSLAGRVAVYAWASGESFRQYGAARRRTRLGLADPLVTNRFLLWGLGIGCVLLLWLHSGFQMARRMSDPTASYPVIAVLGITCAATSWLAFFPPGFYRRRFAAGPA
jgi:hypothetical protein